MAGGAQSTSDGLLRDGVDRARRVLDDREGDVQKARSAGERRRVTGEPQREATEDGGVVYFAKKIDLLKPDALEFVPPKKKKIYTVNELKARLTKEYGHEKWFKEELAEQFGIW